MSSGISSVAQYNPHINAIFVDLFMQELFVDKFHVFNFLSMSDKPRLHQLKIITSSCSSTVQASLTGWMFSSVRRKTDKEEKIPHVENKYKTSPTFQATVCERKTTWRWNSWRWTNLQNKFGNWLFVPRMLYLKYPRYAPDKTRSNRTWSII